MKIEWKALGRTWKRRMNVRESDRAIHRSESINAYARNWIAFNHHFVLLISITISSGGEEAERNGNNDDVRSAVKIHCSELYSFVDILYDD